MRVYLCVCFRACAEKERERVGYRRRGLRRRGMGREPQRFRKVLIFKQDLFQSERLLCVSFVYLACLCNYVELLNRPDQERLMRPVIATSSNGLRIRQLRELSY